jgi:uncharacterized protein (TIGR03437 family)
LVLTYVAFLYQRVNTIDDPLTASQSRKVLLHRSGACAVWWDDGPATQDDPIVTRHRPTTRPQLFSGVPTFGIEANGNGFAAYQAYRKSTIFLRTHPDKEVGRQYFLFALFMILSQDMRSAHLLTLAVLSAGLEPAVWAQSVIVTAAGTDLVFRGNGARAVGVSLGRISKVVVDPSGRPVFADPNYHLILRIETDGSIHVIAGNNVQGLSSTSQLSFNQSGGGYSGDLGPATSAALNRPAGVAYDANGNLYIADTLNHRIRIVNPQGVISTFAGNGKAGYQGEGNPLSVSLNFPLDVAVDKTGNVYVNDSQNFRIRKISQGVISTIAGTGKQGASGENVPASSSAIGAVEGIALDAQGNLYFAEFSSSRVRRISAGVLTTVAGNGTAGYTGDGPALSVSLDSPGGVAVDSSGNVLIADTNNELIRKLAGGNLTTIAGNGGSGFSGDGGPGKSASLHSPFGLATSVTGEVFIADRDNFRIRHLDGQNAISTTAGDGRLLAAQNGVPAQLATFLDPFGVSFDAQGQLLVADTSNNIIRRRNPDGTLTTIAGTGAQEWSGDNGPATQAGLRGPFSVTADASNNLFEAEIDFDRVRRIAPAGTIATIASGLNAPTQAVIDPAGIIYIADFYNNRIVRRAADGTITSYLTSVANPGGLALDAGGSLYFTEWSAGRVWRVSSSGKLTLLAGGGNIAGSAADGGPATNAQLGYLGGVTLDSASNVYFTDVSNATVRKVSPNGTISTVAGNYRPGLSGDGGPATSASLNDPWGLAFDSAGSLYIADVLNNRIRKVLLSATAAPSFTVDAQALSLSATSDGTSSDPATVNLSTSLTGLLYSASTDQPWLKVTSPSGAMPSKVQVSADPTGLASGTYSAKLTVSAPGANPNSRTVTVTLAVGPAQPAGVGVDTKTLSFAFTAGAGPLTRQLTVRNLGSGPLNYSASTCGSAWLAVSPASGSTSPNSPASVTVTATPGSFAPGTYTCALTVSGTSAATPIVIPVSASIAAPSTRLLLTQSGLTFQATPGGGAPLARSFGILNTGQGPMTWSAVATTYSSGSWLSISPASGTVTTPLTDVSQVSVGVDPSKVAGGGAGTYYGKVDVNVPGLRVQSVTIVLNVSSAVTSDIYPSGLVFTGVPGSNPGSQTFSIANLASQSLSFTSSRLTPGGTSWFVHVPTSGAIAPNQPLNIVVQPDFTNLTPGTYEGTISLQFSDGSTANVSLLAVVASSVSATPALTSGMTGKMIPLDATGGCSPTSLNITLSGSQQTLSVSIGRPVAIEVLLTDNCGSVTGNNNSAAASVAFSNFDSNVDLLPIPNQPGKWQQSWTPKNSASGPITMHIRASETTSRSVLLQAKDVTANLASVAPAAAQPLIASVGIQNAASFAAGLPVAPGGLVTIKGSRLADGTDVHLDTPLLTSLCGTQLLLGGTPLPLTYCSDTQINAQIPPGVPLNTQHQIFVVRGDAPPVPSVPDLVAVAAASPAIFTVSQTGQGQGTVVYNGTRTLADPSAPAKAGDILSIYCTGLGEVDQPMGAGQPAPSDPLARTLNPVSVTIGDIPVPAQDVLFAGLTPGSAGLYQVNLRMPSGVTPSNRVPVVLTVAGQQSPPVTMAAQ